MSNPIPVFPWGFQTELAEYIGVSRQYVSGLINREYNAEPTNAIQLEQASLAAGYYVSRWDWLNTRATKNPLFSGNPAEEPLELPQRPRGPGAEFRDRETQRYAIMTWQWDHAPLAFRRICKAKDMEGAWIVWIPRDMVDWVPAWMQSDKKILTRIGYLLIHDGQKRPHAKGESE